MLDSVHRLAATPASQPFIHHQFAHQFLLGIAVEHEHQMRILFILPWQELAGHHLVHVAVPQVLNSGLQQVELEAELHLLVSHLLDALHLDEGPLQRLAVRNQHQVVGILHGFAEGLVGPQVGVAGVFEDVVLVLPAQHLPAELVVERHELVVSL